MPDLIYHRDDYYRKSKNTEDWQKEIPTYERTFLAAWALLENHKLFNELDGYIIAQKKSDLDKDSAAVVTSYGRIYVNMRCKLNKEQWFYTMAHCLLHLAFGHFDKDKIPEDVYSSKDPDIFNRKMALWNKACDIYITRFLMDISVGEPTCPNPSDAYSIKLNDERKIYEHLLYLGETGETMDFGTTSATRFDMDGLKHPLEYKNNSGNYYKKNFNYVITHLTSETISDAGGHVYDENNNTVVMKAARWFISSYPLLGSMAASYKIIENPLFCIRNEIEIAAVNPVKGEIYVNPSCGFTESEWRFVLAHEFLHAGLMHHKRAKGRDPYLWNVACDFVINGWLHEMDIGTIPSKGLLYDEALAGMSAESIYDMIEKNMRKFSKLQTFRGYKKGDVLGGDCPSFGDSHEGVTLDEFFKNSLREGLEYYQSNYRGLVPKGLIEEIRALSMPAIPWDVELGRWFDEQFPPLEKHRSYSRPSRRQSSSPDIPRPRTVPLDFDENSRTFGVVMDTSGSMSASMLGKALGSIASYAVSKEVPSVRVIFCDAKAYDAGYIAPEEIAGRVEVKGRGGTAMQPGIDKLEEAKDFPKTAPILIITDGYIEDRLAIHREHAYLLPKWGELPYSPKGKVFNFT